MKYDTVLRGGTVVTSDSVLPGASVCFMGGKIASIVAARKLVAAQCEDAAGCYILPGLIDLHSDALELAVEPRIGTVLPDVVVIPSLEISFFSSGITTVFHSLLTLDIPPRRKSLHSAKRLLDSLHSCLNSGLLRGSHFAVVRCEMTDDLSVASIGNFMRIPMVRGVSLEDHAPQSPESETHFNRYCRTQLGMNEDQYKKYLNRKLERRQHFWPRAATVARKVRERRLRLLAHDPSETSDVARLRRLGVRIGEFPTSVEVARRARQKGLVLSVGAPNLLIGRSQRGNVSANRIVAARLADMVSSDYNPPSLLPAICRVWSGSGYNLWTAVKMATLNVAAAMGLTDRGCIKIGKRADIIVVRIIDGLPRVEQTYVKGCLVYSRASDCECGQ